MKAPSVIERLIQGLLVLVLFMWFLVGISSIKGAEPEPTFVIENKVGPFTVVNRVPPKSDPADPYGVTDYAAFVEKIKRGMRGVLVVGIPDKWAQSYQLHCRVESGFGGLADGDWDCWLDSRTNTPVLQPRKAAKTPEVVKPPIPFSDSTRATTVPASDGTGPSTSGVVTSLPRNTSSTPVVTRTGRVLYAGPSGPMQTSQCVGFS